MCTSFSNGRITIRPFESGDVASFFAAVRSSMEMLERWMPWCHSEYSLAEAEEWQKSCQREWEGGSSYPFLVVDAENDNVLGSVGINQLNRNHNFGNIGYWVATPYTGKGIATDAVAMVVEFGFQQSGFSRLEIVALTDNMASRRVAERVGARFECIARNRIVAWGKAHDAAIYSLIPGDS